MDSASRETTRRKDLITHTYNLPERFSAHIDIHCQMEEPLAKKIQDSHIFGCRQRNHSPKRFSIYRDLLRGTPPLRFDEVHREIRLQEKEPLLKKIPYPERDFLIEEPLNKIICYSEIQSQTEEPQTPPKNVVTYTEIHSQIKEPLISNRQ